MNTALPRYQAVALASLDDFLERAAALQRPASLPFHSPHWLRAWYETLGCSEGREPIWLALQRRSDAGWVDAMLLPLVQQRRNGLCELAFADAGVVDYVAPIVAPDWHAGAHQQPAARAAWAALMPLLRGYDVWRVEKMLPVMLAEDGDVANPLALAWRTQPGEMFGNQFVVEGPWEGWRRSLDKRVRKEIERSWRVFERSPEARFERITEPAAAQALLQVLEQQQSERMGGQRYYRLDRAPYRAFYRQLLQDGLADGSVVLTALRDGEHVVSALFGVANAQRYIALRQSIGGEAWKACSPGRLLDEGTSHHMHDQGLKFFDFGVGDYFHKATLDMEPIPLRDACVVLSWRGWPVRWAWRLRRRAKHWLLSDPERLPARLLQIVRLRRA
jgi:CelD/BcsL family acetyltransferase involved in cellulose biosynthesis